MRWVVALLAFCVTAAAQPANGFLSIEVISGESAFNSIHDKTAASPEVEVKDEQGRPVAGATVRFVMPSGGASAAFAGGALSAEVKTGENGHATAPSMRPNNQEGQFNIKVTAVLGARQGMAVVRQSNTLAIGQEKHHSKKLWIILAAAGAAAGGAAVALHGGGGGSSAAAPPPTITLSLGGVAVGAPH